jgi:hypothetical protein
MWASSFSRVDLHHYTLNIFGRNHNITLVTAEFSFPSNDFNQTATTIHTKEFVRYQRQRHGVYSSSFQLIVA